MTDEELADILVRAHKAIHQGTMSDLLDQLTRLDRRGVVPHLTDSEIPTLYAAPRRSIADAMPWTDPVDTMDTLRSAAALMVSEHPPPHPRAQMWEALANWLNETATWWETTTGPAQRTDHAAMAAAEAYLEAPRGN